MTIRRAAKRLRELGSAPVLFAALLLAASSAWAAGHSGGHSGGGRSGGGHSSGGGRTAVHSPSSGSSHGSGGSWHNSGGRTAIGSGTHHGPSRQPSHHGNGGFHGGRGGRGYYPYGYGYGYWPGLSIGLGWGWDGWGGWGYPWGYPYGSGYGYGPGYGYGEYDRYSRDDMGALDLDISPGDTEVYINGEKLGTVDDYDGWPQYLWLPKGTYDVVFYRNGYKTLSRQVSVYPGLVIDMDDRLEQGQSVLPQDLQTKTHERRDDRMRYEKERSDRIDRGQWDPRKRDDDNWRDRAHRGRDRRDQGADREDDSNGRAVSSDASWLRLDIDPEDSSVYLDGRFVGTGSELGSLQNGLKVEPGKHHLAVVRPGRKSVERDFDATAGQDVKLSVDLPNGG
jgi:hypothetical protein